MADETIGPTFRPRPRATTASVETDGEIVVYNEATEELHILNHTAAVLWSLFDGDADVGHITDDIAEMFDVEAATIIDDVLHATREMASAGILEGVGPDDLATTPPPTVSEPTVLLDPPDG